MQSVPKKHPSPRSVVRLRQGAKPELGCYLIQSDPLIAETSSAINVASWEKTQIKLERVSTAQHRPHRSYVKGIPQPFWEAPINVDTPLLTNLVPATNCGNAQNSAIREC